MSKFEDAQLSAGGLVLAGAKVDPKSTEEVVARRYGGPALGERVVVRLSAARLGPADDLAMEYLGLEPRGTSEPVARQTRRALGFANWALTNHPDHAKFALRLVKRLKAASRRAKSKPGHAWDEFAEMADELNKSVRNFLPAFWEEVARVFKDLGNQTYAGRSLNKALEAERVHALDVDREHRRDAVLEFTLSGCLSGKALGEYTQDLPNQFEPAEAWATLRDLVVRRTLGGMAPTSSMGKDLLRFAKAAQLNADAEIESVLEEIISSPAMSRAPLPFWESVKPHVKRIVKRNPEFAIWLLVHTNPQARYSGDSTVWPWLSFLDDCAVLPYLWAKKLPAEPEIPGGRAGWIGRLARVETSPDKRVFELLDNMAEVLKEEGQPIPLFQKQRWGATVIDLDVLETVLDLGLEVNETPENFYLDTSGWLRAEVDHPRRNSQLQHVTKHERYGRQLRLQIPEFVAYTGESQIGYRYGRKLAPRRAFEEAATDHPAIHNAWWQYLDELLVRLETGGMPDAQSAISDLQKCVRRRTAEQFPELVKRLQAIDLTDNLHRTFVAGVLDEYGWEALDQADDQAKLPARKERNDGSQSWTFPEVVYVNNDKLMVVHPDRVDPPRTFVFPPKRQLGFLLAVGNDIAIGMRDETNWSEVLVWASDPQNEIVATESHYWLRPGAAVPVGDGVFYGQRVVRPGDHHLPRSHAFFHDGARFWRLKESAAPEMEETNAPLGLTEVDPATGSATRESVPAWFEEDFPPGARIDWPMSQLLPLPQGLQDSPLGSQKGLIGWKVIRRRDGSWEGRGIDGRRISSSDLSNKPYFAALSPLAMLKQPCGKSHWVFTTADLVIDSATGIAIAVSARNGMYSAGQPAPIPVSFLHLLKVRHEPSSQRLRKLVRADAEKLLQGGTAELAAFRKKYGAKKVASTASALARAAYGAYADDDEEEVSADPPGTEGAAAVSKLLPQAPERLVRGLARIARLAAQETESLNNLRTSLEPEDPQTAKSGSAVAAESEDDWRVTQGLVQLFASFPEQVGYFGTHTSDNVTQHLRDVAEFFAGRGDGSLTRCELPWYRLFEDLIGIVWRSFWKMATDEAFQGTIASRIRRPWLDMLEHLARTGLLDLPGTLRLHRGSRTEDAGQYQAPSNVRDLGVTNWSQGENRYLAISMHGYPKGITYILEYAPAKKVQTPTGYNIDQTQLVEPGWKGAQMQSFVDAARTVTELPLATVEQVESAAQQLGVTPIEVAVAWMGNLRTVRYGNDKLTKEIRTFYDWKTKPVQEAIASLNATPIPAEVVSAPILAYPAAILPENQAAAFSTLIAAWQKQRGQTLRFPPDLILLLNQSAPRYGKAPTEELVRLMSNPAEAPLFTPRKFEFNLEQQTRGYGTINNCFTPPRSTEEEAFVKHLPQLIRVINYALPVGDPVRRALPALIDTTRKFLEQDTTLFPFGGVWIVQDFQKFDAQEALARFSQAVGKLEPGQDGLHRFDDGFVLAAVIPPYASLMFRSAGLTTDAEFERLTALAHVTRTWEGSAETMVHFAQAVRELRGAAMAKIAEVNRSAPEEPGGWEQDPRRSAAKTVAAIKKQLKVSEESATLYLQILALPDPSAANIAKWNGWKAAQVKAAAAPLVEAGHLVEAKRARAGRDVFLPGGWEALKPPNLPLESWKLPMYGLNSANLIASFQQLIVPLQPVGELFAAAWDRVKSGDPPRYEEARTK